MHLEVKCPRSQRTIRLASTARTRAELPSYFTVSCPDDGESHGFRREQVTAVADNDPTAGLAVVGALVGLFGGGWGLAIGSLIGAGAGASIRKQDTDAVVEFNNS